LIIQDPDSLSANAAPDGGTVTFQFSEPVTLNDIGVINKDKTLQHFELTYKGGAKDKIVSYTGLGSNLPQRVIVNKQNVQKLVVVLTGPGAITQLNFCPSCS
jgi:hypothetical protein